MKRLLLAISLIPILLTGCSSLAQVAKQLKDDPAFVTVHVRTLYGSGFLVRDGRPSNGNVVTPEGGVQSVQPVVTNMPPMTVVTNITEILSAIEVDPNNPFHDPLNPTLPPQFRTIPPRSQR